MTGNEILNQFFMANRARLLDIAAFLDRLQRAGASGDYRMESFKACLPILSDQHPDKTRRILELLSDPDPDPIDTSPGKGASGAWPGFTSGS